MSNSVVAPNTEVVPSGESAVDTAAIAANLASIRQRMADAASRAQRPIDSVNLVAVSKTHPFAAIEAAYAAGQQDFGENRLEELWQKIVAAENAGRSEALRWHFIGPVQGRKSDQVIGPIALVHSVDRLKIAQRISRDAKEASCVVPVLLEVNVSGEASKHGFAPTEVLEQWTQLARLDGINIQGLMTMAPLVVDAEETRPVFRDLRRLRDEIAVTHRVELPHLSMGMTNDFEVAIEEGATLVRIGTAIFGVRE
jgi:pyridoxal phosphate enzyme (YggS family)